MDNDIKPPFDLMDDSTAWTTENTCRTLELGARYLYEEVQRIDPGSPLSAAVLRLGNAVAYVKANYIEKGIPVPNDKRDKIMTAMDLEGNLGYALWRLRHYRSEGYDYELKQLAQAGDGTGTSKLLLRSHGFVFLISAWFVSKSFGIEFCLPGVVEGPDFIATREGDSFHCEATTKDPPTLRSDTVEEFWRHIHNAVQRKKSKFQTSPSRDDILLIDCSPIAHLTEGSPLHADQLASMDGDGGHGRIDRLILFDGLPFSEGIRKLESLLGDTNISNIVLRNCRSSVRDGVGERRDLFLVLGMIKGRRFWRYFEAPLIFPGPGMSIAR
jgi:hypothetical protein